MGDAGLADNSALLLAVTLAGLAVALAGARFLSVRRGIGFFHHFGYAVLLNLAVTVVLSGQMSQRYAAGGTAPIVGQSPIAQWTTRLTTAFVVIASLERLLNAVLSRRGAGSIRTGPLLAFIIFWMTTVASPSVLSEQGEFAHESVYTLLMGCAALSMSKRESDAAVISMRNALMIFLACSVALIPVRPAMVLDMQYTAGLLPGVPRFAGLSAHPVSMGMLALLALLCLYAQPIRRAWLNNLCWVTGVFVLTMAQSKASWLAFPVCAACILWQRIRESPIRRWADFRAQWTVGLVLVTVPLAVMGLGAAVVFGDVGFTVEDLVRGQQGADLASLSGRDLIWAAALDEWARHPVLGYGSRFLDQAYRSALEMPFATHGHNQLIDTLARSGLVGAAGLLCYSIVLVVLAAKGAKPSRGLSVAILVAIGVRTVSEVPMDLFSYGAESLQQFLLLALFAGGVSAKGPPASVAAGRTTGGGPRARIRRWATGEPSDAWASRVAGVGAAGSRAPARLK